MPIRDQLRDDADRDLDRRAPAERQTDGCAHAREIGQRTSELALAMQDAAQHRVHLATAADHAEIAMRTTKQLRERLLVAGVVARDDDEVVAIVEIAEQIAELVDVGGLASRIAERGMLEQLVAIVEDAHAEARGARERCQRLRDVPRSDHEQSRLRLQEFHEHLHATAAAHPEIPHEMRFDTPRPAVPQALPARVEHLRLDRPATDGADLIAVLTQQEPRTDHLGGGARPLDHGGQRRDRTGGSVEDLDDRPRHVDCGGAAERSGATLLHCKTMIALQRQDPAPACYVRPRRRCRIVGIAGGRESAMRAITITLFLVASLAGCDTKPKEEEKAPSKKGVFDLKQAPPTTASKEELEEARRKAGFKSNEEVMAEARAKDQKNGKIWIKERLKDYRKLVDDVKKEVDDIEKSASKWKDAKAFDAWNDKYKKDVSKLMKGYDELTAKGTEGSDTQTMLAEAMRAWEDLRGDLGPEIATKEKEEAFKAALANIRKELDEFSKALDEIEKDDSLVPEPAEGEAKPDEGKGEGKAEAKGEGKADEKKADKDEKKADKDEKKADKDEKKGG